MEHEWNRYLDTFFFQINNKMDAVLLIILSVGITLISINWLKSELACPPPRIIYRFVPQHTLDAQFSEQNRPGVVYRDMFEKSSVFLHSRGLGDGKTIIPNKFN